MDSLELIRNFPRDRLHMQVDSSERVPATAADRRAVMRSAIGQLRPAQRAEA